MFIRCVIQTSGAFQPVVKKLNLENFSTRMKKTKEKITGVKKIKGMMRCFYLRYFFFLFIASLLGSLFLPSIAAQPASPAPMMRTSIVPQTPDKKNNSSSHHQSQVVPDDSSKVFFVHEQRALGNDFNVNATTVQKMLDNLVCDVTSKPTIEQAWQSLIKIGPQGDRIGIKVATEPGLLSGTHRELVQALVAELIKAGVAPQKIIIWDRRRQDLEAAGYLKTNLNLRWIEYGGGFDPQMVFSSPVVGQLMYGDSEFKESPKSLQEMLHPQSQFSNDSHYALVLSREVDKVINVPSLCDNYYCGVNGALATMTLRNIDNWRRFTREPFFGNPYIAELYNTKIIRKKVVMTIMDALTLQYAGGPRAHPSHAVSNETLFASFDPVAIDATAIRLIDEQRTINHLPKLGDLAGHVQSAEGLKLGHADPQKITLINATEKRI